MTLWSASLLNETNRRLRDEVEATAAALQSRQAACAVEHDALRALRYQLNQTQQQVRELNLAAAKEQQSLAGREDAVKATAHELDGLRRTCAQLTMSEERLTKVVAESAALQTARRNALEAANAETAALEAEVQRVMELHAQRRQSSAALQSSAATERAWRALWPQLSRLTEQVRDYEGAVAREQAALQAVMRETRVVQAQRLAARRDQRESALACEQIDEQMHFIGERTRVNAEAMAALQAEAAARRSVRDRLCKALAELTGQVSEQTKRRALKQRELHTRQNRLRDTLLSLKAQAQDTAQSERHSRLAQAQRGALHEQLAEQTRLGEELQLSLAELRDRHAELCAIRRRLIDENTTSKDSHSAMYAAAQAMLRALQAHAVRLDTHAQRLRSQYDAQLHRFRAEGGRSEALSRDVQRAHTVLSELSATQEKKQEEKQAAQATLDTLQREAERTAALLREAAAVQDTHLRQRRTAEAYALRETLQVLTQQYQHWLRGNTALRATLRQSEAARAAQSKTCEALQREGSALAREVAQMEAELQEGRQTYQARTAQLSEAALAWRTMQHVKEGEVQDMQHIAGWAERLRGAAKAAEHEVELAMQGSRLRLHLEQQAQREKSETLRRLRRHGELLRTRYAETMQLLARRAHHPFLPSLPEAVAQSAGKASDSTHRDITIGPGPCAHREEVTPEMLHAQILLQRSCEREQLQARGNYLDLRLVSLERETQGLQRMLHALRQGSSCANGSEAEVAKVSRLVQQASRTAEEMHERVRKEQQQQQQPAVQLMRDELALQEATLRVVAQHKDELRAQQQRYRKALQELQGVRRQKQLQLQRLRETVQRAQRVAPSQHTNTHMCARVC